MLLKIYPDKARFLDLAQQGNLIPVCMEILADLETPVTVLAKAQKTEEPSFLLESVEGGERWGRYSFVGTHAKKRVRIYKSQVVIQDNGREASIPHGGKPLNVLRDLMAQYKPVSLPELPRFWGGLVGYLSYETVSFFENIPNEVPEAKSLAEFLLTEDLYIFDNVRHTLTLVSHAFLDGEKDPAAAYDEAVKKLETMRKGLTKALPDEAPNKKGAASLKTIVDPEAFREKVSKVKGHIREGDIIQAVISQPFMCDNPPDPLTLYRAQRYVNPSPYMYYLHFDSMTLVGSSPETMVRLENGVATLRPIAGTRWRGKTEQEDRALADELLKDPKERAEHLMLVDLGRNDLGRVAQTGTVQVTDLMVVERYSHVMHLVSNIRCDIRPDTDGYDLVCATFPAGTLTGAPKVRAMEIIADMEEGPRGPYGGAVGYFSFTGNLDLAITIRTASIENGRLTVRAGGGIVADSVPENERMESVNKAKAVERALEMTNEG